MTLSLTDNFNLTRDELIRAAFEDINVAVTNEPLDPDDIQVAQIALNVLVTSWKAHGLQLWKRGRASLTLVASDYDYDLTPTLGAGTEKPMRLLTVNRKYTDGTETDMNKLSLQEYENLPNKTTEGTPVNYYFEPGRLTSTLYVWPAPNATAATEYTIEYVYQQPLQDMDIGTEEIDFPNEWYQAVELALAHALDRKYRTLNHIDRGMLRKDAEKALQLALDYDNEDASLMIQPNNERI